jgi:hypothetical protein
MSPDALSDDQILFLVANVDHELFRAGVDINRRSLEVPSLVMTRLGYLSYIGAGTGAPPIFERVRSAFSTIYRKQDLAVGGHIGVFMYRDIFARIAVPHVFGQIGINPFDWVELTPVQLRIMQAQPIEMAMFLDQFSDVADIQYGSCELKAPFSKMELVARYIGLARLHLHAAAAIVTGGYDYRGAVQSALLATELGLKSAAAALGLSETKIKKQFGHDLIALIDLLRDGFPAFDAERVRRVIANQPKYAHNRYSSVQPARVEVGHLVMGAQYVVAELVRLMSDRDFREGLTPPLARYYPT